MIEIWMESQLVTDIHSDIVNLSYMVCLKEGQKNVRFTFSKGDTIRTIYNVLSKTNRIGDHKTIFNLVCSKGKCGSILNKYGASLPSVNIIQRIILVSLSKNNSVKIHAQFVM